LALAGYLTVESEQDAGAACPRIAHVDERERHLCVGETRAGKRRSALPRYGHTMGVARSSMRTRASMAKGAVRSAAKSATSSMRAKVIYGDASTRKRQDINKLPIDDRRRV
jgi:hypothetical protein